jgi:cobalamin biosynthesis protein CobC
MGDAGKGTGGVVAITAAAQLRSRTQNELALAASGQMKNEHAVAWHGGDVGEGEALFPGGPRPWIDLSTGINPIPYPLPLIHPESFSRLPSRSELAELEAVAATAYGANDQRGVVAAPGTQALIELLPHLRTPGRVAVLGPTYAEHALAWSRAGHAVVEVGSFGDLPDAEVIVLVNPNNPDGRRWSLADMSDLARRSAAQGGWLVVDEAFADLEEVDSLASDLPENAVLLRSFGKTYGLAGVRLGFAIANLGVAVALRRSLGPWPVSGPAIAIGRVALADAGWRRAAAVARSADACRLDRVMTGVVERVAGGTRLFRLYELARAPALFDHFGRQGIWVRRFQHDPAWLRLGLPNSVSAWARLEAALHAFA